MKTSIATVSISGNLREKLSAIAKAGYAVQETSLTSKFIEVRIAEIE